MIRLWLHVEWPKRAFLDANFIFLIGQLVIFALHVHKTVVFFFDWLRWSSQHTYPAGRLWLVKMTISAIEYSQLGPYLPRGVIGLVVMLPFVWRGQVPYCDSPRWPSRRWLTMKALNSVLFTIGIWALLDQVRLHASSFGGRPNELACYWAL